MAAALTSLKNPRWANAEQTMIDCEITTSQFGEEVLPFTAYKDDVEAHSRAIFADIVAGKYGDIGEHVPTPVVQDSTAPDALANAQMWAQVNTEQQLAAMLVKFGLLKSDPTSIEVTKL